jgi:hypothetical protein
MACSSTRRLGHLAPASEVTGGLNFLESAEHALFKMVR